MKDIFKSFISSFNNSPTGMSGKKLSAFGISALCFIVPIIIWTIWAWKHNDWGQLTSVLTIGASLITALWGVNVWDKNKNGDKDNLPSS